MYVQLAVCSCSNICDSRLIDVKLNVKGQRQGTTHDQLVHDFFLILIFFGVVFFFLIFWVFLRGLFILMFPVYPCSTYTSIDEWVSAWVRGWMDG